jgi:hypothetical protein
MRYLIASFMLSFAVNTMVTAQTILPFTFAPGTVDKAPVVNANFQALLTAINRLEGQISAADIPGTYALASMGVYLDSTPQSGIMTNNARVEQISSNATATFNANGTFTLTQETTNGSALAFDFLKNGLNVVTAQAVTQSAAPPPDGMRYVGLVRPYLDGYNQ